MALKFQSASLATKQGVGQSWTPGSHSEIEIARVPGYRRTGLNMSTSSSPGIDPSSVPLPLTPKAETEPPYAKENENVVQEPPTADVPSTQIKSGTSTALTVLPPPELVLCIFIHGFKGTDSTFGAFPTRVGHLVEQVLKVGRGHGEDLDKEAKPGSETLRPGNVTVECLVFPSYEVSTQLTYTF